jgi:hypothetical protein
MSTKFSEDVHLKCLRALRAGGFVCLLPHVIDPAWGGHAVRLAGFPITVCFTGLSSDSEQGRQIVTSCYDFDPSTYLENEDVRTMAYFTRLHSSCSVELLYQKGQCRWEGRKLCDGKVLVTATGPELRQFIVQLTMRGIEPDEAAQGIASAENIAHTCVYLFTPKSH